MLFSETQSTYTSHCEQLEPWMLSTPENPGPWDAAFPDATSTTSQNTAAETGKLQKAFVIIESETGLS